MGIGPKVMRAGDEICVLFGGRVPYVMRPMPDHHVFIGDTFLNDHGIMWGKATEAARFRKGPSPPAVVTFELR